MIPMPVLTTGSTTGLTFTVGTVTAARGSTATVPISVTGNGTTLGFSAVGFVVTYNAAHLDLTRVDSAVSQLPLNNWQLTTTPGSQWVSLVNPNAPVTYTGNDNIANLTFTVKADAPLTESSITITFTPPPRFGAPSSTSSSATNGVLEATLAPGGVNITAAGDGGPQGPPGDRPAGQFGVTISNPGTGASGAGWYAPAASVSINAGTVAGQTFTGWTSSPSVTFANATSAATTFVMPSNDVTVTANWSGGGTQTPTPTPPGGTPTPTPPGGGTASPTPPGGGTASPTPPGGGSGAGQGTNYPVLSHFGTWAGSGTSTSRVDVDHNKFVRLMLGNNVVAAGNYTVTAGSTLITLTEDYIKTLVDGTYTFRAEFTDGYSDLRLIVSRNFGNVPQTGIPDIAGTIIAMCLSIFMTVFLGINLYFHVKAKRNRTNSGSDYGK